jgi:hypothetical protein
MKTKKVGLLLLVIFAISGLLMTSAVKASGFPQLPSGTVTIQVNTGVDTYPLTIVLSNVPLGYDVTNGPYTGFCANLLTTINNYEPYSGATLVSSLAISGDEWNEINYVLNNVPAGATAHDIQAAIWLVQEPFTDAEILADAGFTPTTLAHTMATAAETNGESFIPGPGQIVAVEVVVPDAQNLLIELKETTGPGLTPGFWKHNVGVYLGLANGKYSNSGSPLATQANMATFLSQWSNAQLLIYYHAMITQGGGATGAATRQNTANIFNAAAGLSTTVIV